MLVAGSTDNDSEHQALLLAATKLACSDLLTGRELVSATYTDQLHKGNGTPFLYPREWPVTALSAVKIWDGDSWTTETSTYYELLEQRFVRYPKRGQESNATYGAWPFEADLNIQLTYTAGYVTTNWATALITDSWTVPADLELAVCQLALWMMKEGKRIGVSSETMGPRSVAYDRLNLSGGIPATIRALFASYRRVSF